MAAEEKEASKSFFGSVTRGVGAAGKAAAVWLGTRKAKPKKRAPNRRREAHDAVLRAGSLQQTPIDPVELEAARLAADEGHAALAAALSDRDPAVRAKALSAVVEFSERRATRLLRSTLHDPDAVVRRAAAVAAARLDGISIVASLLVALEDPDSGVRSAAARSIGLITGRTITLTERDLAISPAELTTLKQWWKEQRTAELLREDARS